MKQQILFYLGLLLCIPLLPILHRQAGRVRATVPRHPEAEGAEGAVGNGSPAMRLLTLGESTVAGVGIPHHRDGFTGWIARHASERSGRRVRWTALGRTGYSARQVAARLVPRIPTSSQDLIVIGLGGNDTFQLHSPSRWRRDLIGLIRAVRERQPECPIVIANMPPIRHFPAFPGLMQRVLGGLVRLHGDVIADLPSRLPGVHYASRRIRLDDWTERSGRVVDPADLFCDGVHPSSLTYEVWCEELVDLAWAEAMDRFRPV